MKKFTALVLLALLILVAGPVLLHLLQLPESRVLRGEHLDPARFTPVDFHNDRQDIDLAGMLFVPGGAGPFPAVVVIQGSGASRRDNGWYLSLAHYLQDHEVAVLLPDKRGSEQSEGNWRDASFEDLATDTLAAIRFLRSQDQVPVSGIGIVGMSQGGWIAPLVAVESPHVDFVVDVVGSAVSTHEQLIYEEDHNLQQAGMLPGISRAAAYASTFVLREFTQKPFWDAVGDFDPLPYWRDVGQPVLALFGAEDTNTPSLRSAALLRQLGKPNIRVIVFEESGHALQDPPGVGDRVFREDALKAIADFALGRSR